MKNTESTSDYWVSYLAGLAEVSFGEELKLHFDAGGISRLCDCGCNSFDISIPDGVSVEPICSPSVVGGKFFELVALTEDDHEIAFLFFADKRGYLSGIDITQGSENHAPLPDNVAITKVLYTI